MNPFIDFGMLAIVAICIPFIISECVRLGRMYDAWEKSHIENQLRKAKAQGSKK